MRFLVTGGAGFIGRWVVKKLLSDGNDVWVLDNLSNSAKSNLDEFASDSKFHGLSIGSVEDSKCVQDSFRNRYDICIHSAAQINVQDSLDNPERTFNTNVIGTYNILKCALKSKTKVTVIGTCMVYDTSQHKGISELSPVKPASPYAGSKLSAENLALSYYYGLGLPIIILRPFNTYGPFQKTTMEGGVVSIFIHNKLQGEKLRIFGDGTQTRDFLYVEDCADFIVKATFSDKAIGQIINAGLGIDISINDLAFLICKDTNRIERVKNPHPHSEIPKLLCANTKARKILNWQPKTTLEEGILRTELWINHRGGVK
jgi:nucleoside-diphosphate-sugar epimerase